MKKIKHRNDTPFSVYMKKRVSLTHSYLLLLGQHRALGVHITKIKSVNLDKWPEGKVEAFQAMSNNLVNAYWEANLPRNF